MIGQVLRGLGASSTVKRIFWRNLHISNIMAKYNVVFVLGGPGAGKGTQCDYIVRVSGLEFIIIIIVPVQYAQCEFLRFHDTTADKFWLSRTNIGEVRC